MQSYVLYKKNILMWIIVFIQYKLYTNKYHYFAIEKRAILIRDFFSNKYTYYLEDVQY